MNERAPSAVEEVPTETPKDLVVKMEIEYDTQTGAFRMKGVPANAVMTFGLLEMAKETLMKSRLKAEIAQEILATKPEQNKIVKPPPNFRA